jgi:hypothetical protein
MQVPNYLSGQELAATDRRGSAAAPPGERGARPSNPRLSGRCAASAPASMQPKLHALMPWNNHTKLGKGFNCVSDILGFTSMAFKNTIEFRQAKLTFGRGRPAAQTAQPVVASGTSSARRKQRIRAAFHRRTPSRRPMQDGRDGSAGWRCLHLTPLASLRRVRHENRIRRGVRVADTKQRE